MSTSVPTAYIDSWLAFRQRYMRIPGVQAAILCGNEIVLSGAYGPADIESGASMTERHLFRIASHSKTFTATAIMHLVEAGKVRIDDTLPAHLERIAAAAPKIVARGRSSQRAGDVRDRRRRPVAGHREPRRRCAR